MQPLDRDIRKRLKDILERSFKITGRRALVENALYGAVALDHIEWEGSDYVFSTHLINLLMTHDRDVEAGTSPLVALLNECRDVADAHGIDEIDGLLAELTPKPRDIIWHECPYPGLMAFTAREAPVFFGRDREARRVLQCLEDPERRFLCVVGDSGSGKSSLIAAGVIPKLNKDWPVRRFVPGDEPNPFLSLAWCFKEAADALGQRPHQLAEELRTDVSRISELCDIELAGRTTSAELVLYMDQMEELFSVVDTVYREDFIELIDYCASQSRLRLIATLPADVVPLCINHPVLAELLRDAFYPLALPGPTAIYAMVEGPAKVAGLSIDQDLMDCLLEATRDGPGRLPLMAYVLRQLWERRENDCLTLDAYNAIGGIVGAITRAADAALETLDSKIKSSLPLLFRCLVNVGPEGQVACRRADMGELCAIPYGEALAGVLSGRDARLLVVRGDDEAVTLEIAHESLLRSWTPIAKWVEAQQDDLRLLAQVKLAAGEWDHCGRDISHLWTDERLDEVRQMLDRQAFGELDEPMSAFVHPVETLAGALTDTRLALETRVAIGDRLAKLGDPRRGVGLRDDGVPDIDWVAIPGGRVTLENDSGSFDVLPFYIARYPVTFQQYQAFLYAEDGYVNPAWWGDLGHKGERGEQFRQHANCPADNVSWYDAIAYARWLSHQLGFAVGLPTEWQWQQAASGGDRCNIFPWGACWQEGCCNTHETRLSRSCTVGLFPQGQTAQGVADMAGNVWEWCLNEGNKPKFRISKKGNDWCVLRGGSWGDIRDFARCAFRDDARPNFRNDGLGFRLCCESPIN